MGVMSTEDRMSIIKLHKSTKDKLSNIGKRGDKYEDIILCLIALEPLVPSNIKAEAIAKDKALRGKVQ